jgi:hypothetical protein
LGESGLGLGQRGIEQEWSSSGILGENCREDRGGQIVDRRCGSKQIPEGRGWRWFGKWLAQQGCEYPLVVINEYRSVLEQGILGSPLGTADELASAGHELPT